MKRFVLGSAVVLALVFCNVASAATDFSNMSVASVAYGRFDQEPAGWRLLAYDGDIYFAPWDDGSANPSKVLCYNPANGLSNGVNHTTLAETTGRFTTMTVADGSLYMADSTGNVLVYNGATTSPLTGTPFSTSNYVTAMTELNGKLYLGTSQGTIYDGSTYQSVYQSPLSRPVNDLSSWNGSLFAGLVGDVTTNNGFAVRSNGSDLTSWQTEISGVYSGSEAFLATPAYIYACTVDDCFSHSSTVRRSSDGVNFTTISGPGPFKFPIGNPMYYEGTAYIFENSDPNTYNNGYLVTDDGTTATMTAMASWDYRILAATELNGQVYAIGLNTPSNGCSPAEMA